jgi:hypothetical protein
MTTVTRRKTHIGTTEKDFAGDIRLKWNLEQHYVIANLFICHSERSEESLLEYRHD